MENEPINERLDRAAETVHDAANVIDKAKGELERMRNVLHAAQILTDAIHVSEALTPAIESQYANLVDALNTYYRA